MRALTFAASALAAGAILAGTATLPAGAQGYEFPYCTIGGWATDGICRFNSFDECLAFVQGVGGSCTANPRATPPVQSMRSAIRPRR